MESAINEAAMSMGYELLKEEQKRSIEEFMKGNDVFVILHTGFGKTACFACLPNAFNIYFARQNSIIIVVSPLTALIRDQVNHLSKYISVGNVDADSSPDMKANAIKGDYNILYMSPELLVTTWRSLFSNSEYQKQLVGLVVDEAHCVVKW